MPGELSLPLFPDEDALATYRAQLMPVFPFVVIPDGAKADQLKAERPFLFAAIRMAAFTTDIWSRRVLMYQCKCYCVRCAWQTLCLRVRTALIFWISDQQCDPRDSHIIGTIFGPSPGPSSDACLVPKPLHNACSDVLPTSFGPCSSSGSGAGYRALSSRKNEFLGISTPETSSKER